MRKFVTRWSAIAVLLIAQQLLLNIAHAQTGLPPEPTYRGDVYRNSDGKLTVTQTRATASSTSSAKTQQPTLPSTLHVGKLQRYKTIKSASLSARDGDTVEIEAGDYVGDVAIWNQDNLTIRGVGGRVRLIANGQHVERKGIWIMRGGKITVEGLDFIGAKVEHHNGAGIRFEKGHLIVRDCGFFDNENGILTHSDETSMLDVENSEFGNNGFGDGESHNIYVGAIGRFRMTGSYSHRANVGQLVKSRARESFILYNRLTDEDGHASYELDLPSGGIAYVIGNTIQQSPNTINGHMISFGVEGYKWPSNELYLVNNTIIDNRPSNGKFLLIKPNPTKIYAVNNLNAGPDHLNPANRSNIDKSISDQLNGFFDNNPKVELREFVDPKGFDYRLTETSTLRGAAILPTIANGLSLLPKKQYKHPRTTVAISKPLKNPGALQ